MQGYFDTLRMEVVDKGIDVQCVCPGPVDTPFMRDIFSTQLNSQTKVSLLLYSILWSSYHAI